MVQVQKDYIAFIDEAGDEGFTWFENIDEHPDLDNGSSRWLILGAVIVEKDKTDELIDLAKDIKDRIGIPDDTDLHWQDHNHKRKKFIAKKISERDFKISYVAVDKTNITSEELIDDHQRLYFYASRFLIERISWLVDDLHGEVDCIFEFRGNISNNDLAQYVSDFRRDSEIRDVIKDISAYPGSNYLSLQIADCCTGALHNALRLNNFGDHEPTYIETLQPLLYRRSGRLINYGLKFWPTNNRWRDLERIGWIDRIV